MVTRFIALAFWLTFSMSLFLFGDCEIAASEPERYCLSNFKVELLMPSRLFRDLPCIAEVKISNLSKEFRHMPMEEILKMPEKDQTLYLAQEHFYQNAFPDFNLNSLTPPVSLKVIDVTGKSKISPERPGSFAFWVLPPELVAKPVRVPCISLFPGEVKTSFVDVGFLFQNVPAGTYKTTLFLYRHDNDDAGLQSNEVPVQIANLSDEAVKMLRNEFPHTSETTQDKKKRGEREGHSCWISKNTDVFKLKRSLPRGVFQTIAPYLFLGEALKSQNVAETPLLLLDDFPEHLQALAACLHFEVLVSRGQKNVVEKELKGLIKKYPSLKWRLEEIKADKKKGMIHSLLANSSK